MEAKNYGLVSIIMPCYNAAAYIKETVESVLAQTYPQWELLVVDDCSTDDSLAILAGITDPRIRVLKNETNSGAAATRNVAIEAANGRYIAFLDSDDLWHPEKLAEQLAFMTEKDCALSFTHYAVINGNAEPITVYTPKKQEYYYADILKHCSIGCSTVVYDTEKLGKVYMPTNAPKREDAACWLQILRGGEVAHCLHKPLMTYRIHTNSVSSSKVKMIRYQWHLYRKVEGLSLVRSAYCMTHWAIKGFLKYR